MRRGPRAAGADADGVGGPPRQGAALQCRVPAGFFEAAPPGRRPHPRPRRRAVFGPRGRAIGLTMASQRQLAANRRNARGSTGPRSPAGKTRASQNAFRHGLTTPLAGAAFARAVATLARQFAGDRADHITRELARDAAAAALELARVRRVRTALIERVAALGRFDVPKRFRSPMDEAAWIRQRYWGATLCEWRTKFAVDPLASVLS